jgi:hypothetical protein
MFPGFSGASATRINGLLDNFQTAVAILFWLQNTFGIATLIFEIPLC